MASATRTQSLLTLEAAQACTAACQTTALSLGVDMNIALVDSTLTLLSFIRQPNAKLTSIQTAIDKAFTAAGHRAPTSLYTNSPAAKNFLPGGPGYGIHNTNGGRFCVIGGGLPIWVDGVCVGAVGVSSGSPAQDEQVAKAGVEAVEGFVKKTRGAKL